MGAQRCGCLRERIRDRALGRIPPVYRPLRLATIEPDANRHALQPAIISAMRITPQKSFAFYGANGCGKTLFSWLLYRDAVDRNQMAVGLTLAVLLEQFRAYERDPDKLADIMPFDLRQDSRKYFVFLDELDKARPSEFSAEMLFLLMDAIVNYGHQVVVTSNLLPCDLSAHWSRNGDTYGPSILRRIREIADGVEVEMV